MNPPPAHRIDSAQPESSTGRRQRGNRSPEFTTRRVPQRANPSGIIAAALNPQDHQDHQAPANSPAGSPANGQSSGSFDVSFDQDTQSLSTQHLLALQSDDLIAHLQQWAADLDSREAQLNARTSLQEHRERQFRIERRDAEAELAEQQRLVERMRQSVQVQARRLAFREG
ncbi:hypothetical protein N9N28_03210 [Rubripirellula amarantea]|uniref:Uncharacterized protein n=1 Tax=Rubripirellula amarantea TaxID=2527999 RepID=A0A5C5WQJ6_9BACT|nr:hypothetical protein [Rubripirellula amarantea]MDA8743622.1 hypothetical protein [Rubripirellula amarantea]TWT52429.1 hypothetical protein Pla22_00530 [Rubripirellula amarantea]